MTAPERIWVQWPHVNGAGLAFTCQARPPALRHEYIRSDLATPAAMTPEVRALEKEVLRLKAKLWAIGHAAGIETKEDLMQAALAALRAGGYK